MSSICLLVVEILFETSPPRLVGSNPETHWCEGGTRKRRWLWRSQGVEKVSKEWARDLPVVCFCDTCIEKWPQTSISWWQSIDISQKSLPHQPPTTVEVERPVFLSNRDGCCCCRISYSVFHLMVPPLSVIESSCRSES
jgi:hypothetical protein